MQDHDKDVDDEYFSKLYASLKPEQPSTELDEKILKEARDATVASDGVRELIPKKAGGPFSGKWLVPVSLAAVMVLSVTVVVMIEHDRPYSLTSLPEPARQELKYQATERLKPSAESQAVQQMAKKSESSSGEQAGTERLQALQPPQARGAPQTALATAPPVAIESDNKKDSESDDRKVARSIGGVHTKSKFPAGISPAEKAPPVEDSAPPKVAANTETSPRLKLVETETAKKREPAPAESSRDEVVAEAAPAAVVEMQTELPAPVAEMKDDAEKAVSEQREAAKTTTPAAAQTQVQDITLPAEASVKNAVAAQAQTKPQSDSQTKPLADSQSGPQSESLAATVSGESTPSESTKSSATSANAPAAVLRSALDQAKSVPEQPNVAMLDEVQHEPATQALQAPSPPAAEVDSTTKRDTESKTQNETTSETLQSSQEVADQGQEQASADGSPAGFSAAALAPAETTDNSGLVAQCRQMSQQDCLVSSSCILQQQVDDKSYVCRAATNACEAEFSQVNTGKDLCEQRPGCRYIPANCFCAPGEDCSCTGGTPAMCVPKVEND